MKVKVKDVVSAYKVLGDAKVVKLEELEIIKVVKARKAMRPIADDYDAFLKDCQEKFKPEGWYSRPPVAIAATSSVSHPSLPA